MTEPGVQVPTQNRRFAAAMLTAFLGVTSPAFAIDLPSGQPVELQEVLLDELGGETWVRFRFIAPEIARVGGNADLDAIGPDMKYLCDTVALPYMAEFELTGQMIVVSLADRTTEFGIPAPGATQFFEAYRTNGFTCIWEGL